MAPSPSEYLRPLQHPLLGAENRFAPNAARSTLFPELRKLVGAEEDVTPGEKFAILQPAPARAAGCEQFFQVETVRHGPPRVQGVNNG